MNNGIFITQFPYETDARHLGLRTERDASTTATTFIDAVETLGDNAIPVQGDVTFDADLNNPFSTTVKRFGRVDVVFANAGVAAFQSLDKSTDNHLTASSTSMSGGYSKPWSRQSKH